MVFSVLIFSNFIGRKLAEMLKKSSGFVDPVKSIYDDVSAISSNRVDPCRTSETLSDDSIVSTNKRCSSTSSDQSRDEINPRPKSELKLKFVVLPKKYT